MLNEFEEKIRKRIDELMAEKRFDEAATLAVHMALMRIDPKELTEYLIQKIKEYEERNATGGVKIV